MNPKDILMWPDGFWCMREEFSRKFLREADFRVIEYHCAEWHQLNARGQVY